MTAPDPKDLPRLIRERIDLAVSERATPQIVLDLDGTLFDNVPRTKAILLDSARHLLGADSAVAETIAEMHEEDFEYNPVDTLRKHGVDDEDALLALREEWARRFFGSGYLRHDAPLRGAVEATKEWWELGAELNYLTGRHVPEMYLGTSRSLAEAGFPIGTIRTQLLMKPRFDLEDVKFKIEMAPYVRKKGPVALVVDNDPGVLNPLTVELPESLAVMVTTLHPKEAPPPDSHITVVEDFRQLGGR